jgi:hypothetical protein
LDADWTDVGSAVQVRRTELGYLGVELLERVSAAGLLGEAADGASQQRLGCRVVGIFEAELLEGFAAFAVSLEAVKSFGLAEEAFLCWLARGRRRGQGGLGIRKGSIEPLGPEEGKRAVEPDGAGLLRRRRAGEGAGVAV